MKGKKILIIIVSLIILSGYAYKIYAVNKRYTDTVQIENIYIKSGENANLYGDKIKFKDATLLTGEDAYRELAKNGELEDIEKKEGSEGIKRIYGEKAILKIDMEYKNKKTRDYNLNIDNKKINVHNFKDNYIEFLLDKEDIDRFKKSGVAYMGNSSHLFKKRSLDKDQYQTSLNDGERRVILEIEYNKVKK